MIYHLDTIPVWEAMEKETPCPFCALYERMEQQEVERSLGGSVMEPDTRIRVNETGICARHHQQLFGMQNRLGHALLTDSHSKELLKKLEKLEKQAENLPKRGLFSKRTEEDELAAALRALSSGCVICEGIDSHMKRYLYTFVHLWKTDAAFVKKWEASNGLCLPHAADLLEMASQSLSGEKYRQFAFSVLSGVRGALETDEKDLEWFTLKFDYRNQSKPWGNSRNALERTANRLRGRCIVTGEKDTAK